MKKQLITLASAAAILVAAQSSFAGSTNAGNLNYQVTLNPGCSASVTSPGPWPTQNPAYSSFSAGAGDVTVTCTKTTPYGICLNGGLQPNPPIPGPGTRQLASGANKLTYTLQSAGAYSQGPDLGDSGCATYTGFADSAAWANPIGGALFGLVGDAPNPQVYNLTANVAIPPNAVPGTYTDTVAVNVVF